MPDACQIVRGTTGSAYLGDTDFAALDPEALESGFQVAPEGNARQAEFTLDNKYVIGADEDFGPYALTARNLTDNTEITASQGSNTMRLEEGQTITGDSVFAGRACIGTDACDQTLGMSVEGDIPTFGVAPRGQGFALFGHPYDDAACLAGTGPAQLPVALGAKGDRLTFSSYFDGLGYAHLYRNQSGKLTELDTYAVPKAHDPAYASDSGDLSIHEVAVSEKRADLLHFSYYAAGLRVAKIIGDKIVEGGTTSDRDHGLYIFEYTGGLSRCDVGSGELRPGLAAAKTSGRSRPCPAWLDEQTDGRTEPATIRRGRPPSPGRVPGSGNARCCAAVRRGCRWRRPGRRPGPRRGRRRGSSSIGGR